MLRVDGPNACTTRPRCTAARRTIAGEGALRSRSRQDGRSVAPSPADARRARRARAQPGDPLPLDSTTLGRCWSVGKRITCDDTRRYLRAGWQQIRVAVDERSRLADTELRSTARRADAFVVLDRLLAWFRALGSLCRL